MAVGSKLPPADSDSEQEDSTSRSALHVTDRTTTPFSDDSLQFLKRASKVLMKKQGTSRYGKMQRLYEQLVSLRSVVPYFNPNRKVPCVISDALEYKEQLKKQLQQLKQIESEVDVTTDDDKILIRVCCEKRPNLLSSLMEEIETIELAYEEVNISCGEKLDIRALGLQIEGKEIDTGEVKRRLVSIIQQSGANSSTSPSNS